MARQKTDRVRYASYARCSADDQTKGDFTTIDTQRDLNARHIATLGGELVAEYQDDGITGTTLKRKGWDQLLSDAKAGKFEAVCVTYMSRLGRGDAFTVAEYLLKESRVRVVMVKEQFSDDLGGHVNKKMTQFVDGMYVEQVRQWTRTKMEAMVAKGYVAGGVAAFGYLREPVPGTTPGRSGKTPQYLVPDPDTAPIVYRAFQIYAETGSTQQSRHYLKAMTDRNWSLDSVSRLLRNEVYRGVLVFGDWRNEKAHEAIISPELWEAVQARHQAALRAPKHDPKDKTPFPLRGLVFCSHCGCRMTPASHHGRIGPVGYYECIVNTKARSSCPVKRVNASSLHDAVLDHIRRGAEHPTRLNELIKGAVEEMPVADVRQDQVQSLSKRIREVEKKEKAIMSAIESGGAALRSLIERLGELQDQAQRLRLQRQDAEARVLENKLARPDVGYIRAMWQNFLAIWDGATDEEKSVLMPLIVERVELREKEYGKVRLSFAPAGAAMSSLSDKHSENRFATDRVPALRKAAHKIIL